MKVIVAVDEKNGMMFNKRRQSKDRVLREKIVAISRDTVLRMNSYSRKQFEPEANILVSESFLEDAGAGEYCFVENKDISPYADQIEELILFHWNRTYPADFHLTFLPQEHGMTLEQSEAFEGNSHEKITMEVWKK